MKSVQLSSKIRNVNVNGLLADSRSDDTRQINVIESFAHRIPYMRGDQVGNRFNADFQRDWPSCAFDQALRI